MDKPESLEYRNSHFQLLKWVLFLIASHATFTWFFTDIFSLFLSSNLRVKSNQIVPFF